MTKKNILIFTAIIIIFHISYFNSFFLWRNLTWVRHFADFIPPDSLLLFIFSPILFFSLITYRLPDAVFTRWWHFTRWFIPLSMFLVLIAPGKGGDAIPTPEFGPIIFIFMMTIYVIISIVKIVWAYREGKRTPIIDQKS